MKRKKQSSRGVALLLRVWSPAGVTKLLWVGQRVASGKALLEQLRCDSPGNPLLGVFVGSRWRLPVVMQMGKMELTKPRLEVVPNFEKSTFGRELPDSSRRQPSSRVIRPRNDS